MNSIVVSLLSLLTVTLMTFADQRDAENLSRLALRDNVSFSMGELRDQANFSKLADMDQRKVDADLAKYKITRVSDAFISKDGRYVMTFARDAEANAIKRVIFLYDGETIRSYADQVIDVTTTEIKTSKGSVRVSEGFLLSN